jgi:hypothetical protein
MDLRSGRELVSTEVSTVVSARRRIDRSNFGSSGFGVVGPKRARWEKGGSLGLAGGAETVSYLPRCDLGAVLVDSASALDREDLALLRALSAAGETGNF